MRALARGFAVVGRLLRGLLAAIALLAVLAGLPVALVVFIGWPLPDHIPGMDEVAAALTSPLDDQTILDILAVLAWILWAHFLRDVAVEVLLAAADISAARHGRTPPARRRVGPVRFVAAILVGAIAGAILLDLLRGAARPASTGATAAHAAGRTPAVAVAAATTITHTEPAEHATGTGPRPAIATPARPAITSTTAPGRGGSFPPVWATAAPGGAHHVVKGDNLWDIAETRLGDPFRWREIYLLNRNKPQANGYTLDDPDEIHIGWWLALPARNPATTPAPAPAPHKPTAPGGAPAPTEPPPTEQAPAPPPVTTPATPPPTATPPASAAAPTGSAGNTPTTTTVAPDQVPASEDAPGTGVTLPSQAWVSLALAATIAAVTALVRLRRRRRAHLTTPIRIHTGPAPTPVPESLKAVDTAGIPLLDLHPEDTSLSGVMPAAPPVPAPVGVDTQGEQISLFDLPGAGIALHGEGALQATRAVLASVLSTGVVEYCWARPVVATSADTLARLLPHGVEPVGLDPHHTTYDEDRLIVLADTGSAVTHLEEEMIHRRRLLDSMNAVDVAELNARDGHVEFQPDYVFLLAASDLHRYTARIAAVAQHRAALHIHPVIIGELDGLPAYHLNTNGIPTTTTVEDGDADAALNTIQRWPTLAAGDLADVLDLVRESVPRPELGIDIEQDPAETDPAAIAADNAATLAEIPTPASDQAAPVTLTVLGPITLTAADGPIAHGVRTGSYAVLALLAAHPTGRTLSQFAAALHPDTDKQVAAQRIRTDVNAVRTILRKATGITGRGVFITYDSAAERYRLDPDLIGVDLWRMLAAIDRANKAGHDDAPAALAALREAAALYGGDFSADQDWAVDYATVYRHQILNVYARIAELLEPDHPDQAVAALEKAVAYDPVNEELYQRIMRIHGRQGRPDAVRRTLRLLENRYADLGEAEISEATRQVAHRQLDTNP